MTRRDALYAFFRQIGMAYRTVDHRPLFTVEDGIEVKKTMAGGHSKNLFVKDKKGRLMLITALAETPIDLVALGKYLKCKGRLSFARAELMEEVLGVTPGSVTPFALIHDEQHRVDDIILDKALFDHDPVWFHPLENNASTAIAANDLLTFMNALERQPVILPLAEIKRPPAISR